MTRGLSKQNTASESTGKKPSKDNSAQAGKSPNVTGGKKGKKVKHQLICHACDVKTESLVSLEYHVNNWHTNIKWICEHDGCWHLFSTRQIFVSHVK